MNSDIKVVHPSGIFDGVRASQVRQEIDEVVASGSKTILIDLQDVTFMDSSGLGALVSALKVVKAAGGRLFLCAINEQIKMLFELTSMDRVFKVFPDRLAFEQADLSS